MTGQANAQKSRCPAAHTISTAATNPLGTPKANAGRSAVDVSAIVDAKPRVSLPPRTDCIPPTHPPGGQTGAITSSFPVMEGTSPSFTAKQQIRLHGPLPSTANGTVNSTKAAQEPVKRTRDPTTWANPHQTRVCVTPHCRDPARLLDRTLRRLVMREGKN